MPLSHRSQPRELNADCVAAQPQISWGRREHGNGGQSCNRLRKDLPPPPRLSSATKRRPASRPHVAVAWGTRPSTVSCFQQVRATGKREEARRPVWGRPWQETWWIPVWRTRSVEPGIELSVASFASLSSSRMSAEECLLCAAILLADRIHLSLLLEQRQDCLGQTNGEVST
jgi:hypothetical protein